MHKLQFDYLFIEIFRLISKELNRIRRAALSLGFVELLESLSTLFEREILLLPTNVSPDCAIQLKHSAIELRKMSNREIKATITPVSTKFNQT